MINRLIEPTSGTIELDGRDSAPCRCTTCVASIGYVIQQAGLFPHRTVADNIATVPKLLGWDKRAPAQALARADRPRRPRTRDGRPLPASALRRPAAARRGGPRARRGPARAADGRAVRRRRPVRAARSSGSSGGCSASSRRRSCSSPTTSTRRSCSATASRSCARAARSRSTARPDELLAQPAGRLRGVVHRRHARPEAAVAALGLGGPGDRRRPGRAGRLAAAAPTTTGGRSPGAAASGDGPRRRSSASARRAPCAT